MARSLNKRFAMGILLIGVILASSANATFVLEESGVVLDRVTGLEWQKQNGDASWRSLTWSQANAYANNLNLDSGGWSFATGVQLLKLFNEIRTLTGCTGCTGNQGPFTGIQRAYWSSTNSGSGTHGLIYPFLTYPLEILDGFQFAACAVQPAEVGVAVSETAALDLLGIALAGLGFSRSQKPIAA